MDIGQDVVEWLQCYVDDCLIDLVVIGIYGCCGIWWMFFGSVVECFLCEFCCLVLFVCDEGFIFVVVVV